MRAAECDLLDGCTELLKGLLTTIRLTHHPMAAYWATNETFYFNDCFKEMNESLFAEKLSIAAEHLTLKETFLKEAFGLIEKDIKHVLVSGAASYSENQLISSAIDSSVKAYWNYSCSPIKNIDADNIFGVIIVANDTTQQVCSTQKAKEEREQLAELFQQTPTFMAILRGAEHRVDFANPGYLRLVGDRDILGKTVAEALPDAVEQGYLSILDDVYNSGKTFSATGAKYAMQVEPNGPVVDRYVDFVFQPIKSDGKAPKGIFIEGVDVTDRVIAEARRSALSRLTDEIGSLKTPSEIAFKAAQILGETLNLSRVGYGDIDPIAETLTVDKDWCAEGVQTLAGTLNLRDFGSFIDDLKLGKFISINNVETDARTAIAANALKDRSAGSFVNTPVIEQGKLVAVFFINNAEPREWSESDLSFIKEIAIKIRLASERLRNEKALAESEAKFRTITDAMPQMVWSTLPDGYHDYFNEQWYAFTGVERGSTDGELWPKVLHPDDRMRTAEVWQESLNSGKPYEILYRHRHNTGEYRWTLGRALPIKNSAGEIIRWMGTCTDINAQKMAEEELRESNNRKDEFLAMLAHELRNPLAPISSSAHVLTMIKSDDERIKRSSEVIVRQVQHMTNLVDDLLDVSRLTRGLERLNKNYINIDEVLNNAIEQSLPLIQAREHTLDVQTKDHHLIVYGDQTRLTQVISNLLTNAAKYTPIKGRIVISVYAETEKIIISVSDNGVGISAELLPFVFDTFTQGERNSDRTLGGLGLGLTLVKKLVTLHHGDVKAFSNGKDLGSIFTVTLPQAKTSDISISEKPQSSFARKDSTSLKLMIVDDNTDAAETLSQLLQFSGYETITSSDGKSALEKVTSFIPEVFILDIGLPDIDGYQLAQQLRKIESISTATIIALTGYGQSHDRQSALESGFNHHLTKPVNFAELKNILDSINL